MKIDESCIRQGINTFRDEINFPKGISRCGAFSINQSETLRIYGETLKYLQLGVLLPETEAEIQFVTWCKGEKPAESLLEKLWDKYQCEIRRRKSFHTVLGQHKPRNAENDGNYKGYANDYGS